MTEIRCCGFGLKIRPPRLICSWVSPRVLRMRAAVSRIDKSSSWSRLRSMSSVNRRLRRAKEIKVCFRTSEFLFST